MAYDTGPLLPGESAADPARVAGRSLRVAAQVVGLGMILVGGYFALGVLLDAALYLRDPASLDGPVLATAKLLGLEQAEVKPPGGAGVPIGRSAGFVGVVIGEVVVGVLSLGLVRVGARLVHGAVDERREFLRAMREFLVAARRDGPGAGGGSLG